MPHAPISSRRIFNNPTRREEGIALVMVLWLVVLLTIVAASFATHSRIETRMAGNLVDRLNAKYMTETGFNRAILELISNRDEDAWSLNGEVHEIQDANGSLRISIRNSAGLVDLNRGSRQVLLNLFKLLDEDEEIRNSLADALEDWRDGDDARRFKGAEDDDYVTAGYAYGAADRDLETVDELGYVMGFNRDSVERLRPYVTVHSGQSGVDNRFASDQLNLLLSDGVSMNSGISQAFDQLESELANLGGEEDFISGARAASEKYRVSVEAQTQSGARSALYVDIEMRNRDGKAYTILDWHHSL